MCKSPYIQTQIPGPYSVLCVCVCRSQRCYKSSNSARSHSEAESRADLATSLGEGYGFSLQAEGAHRQSSEEHSR